MNDERDPKVGSTSTTVRDRVHPTVVRRRVYDVGPSRETGGGSPAIPRGHVHEEGDSSGPPSSLNVARALASLRGDELERIEELLRQDDEDEAARAASAVLDVEAGRTNVETTEIEAVRADARVGDGATSSVPTLTVGRTITVTELARRMKLGTGELVESLVKLGFFSANAKTSLGRETIRAIAGSFGWRVEYEP